MRDNFIDSYMESLMASDYVDPEVLKQQAVQAEPQSLMAQPNQVPMQNATQVAPQQPAPVQQPMVDQGPPQRLKRGFWGRSEDRASPTLAKARMAKENWEIDSYYAKKYIQKYGASYGPEMAKQMAESKSPSLIKRAMSFKEDGLYPARTMATIGAEGDKKQSVSFNRQTGKYEKHGVPVSSRGPLVQVGGEGDTVQKARTKRAVDREGILANSLYSAGDEVESLDATITMAEGAYETGAVEDELNFFRKALTRVGVPFDKQASSEALRGRYGRFAMEEIANTKGAVSDKEMEFFQKINPNVYNTREGNLAILDVKKQIAVRRRNFLSTYEKDVRAGNSPQSIEQKWNSFKRSNSLDLSRFETKEKKSMVQTVRDTISPPEETPTYGSKGESKEAFRERMEKQREAQ